LTRTIFDRPTTAGNVVDLGVLEKSVRPLPQTWSPVAKAAILVEPVAGGVYRGPESTGVGDRGRMTDVAADVVAIIAGKLRNERPQIELTDKLEDLGLESLDAVEMIFELEEKFDITIPYNANDSRTEFDTVGDVVRAVEKLVDGKA
jgi:acyl carrier protein